MTKSLLGDINQEAEIPQFLSSPFGYGECFHPLENAPLSIDYELLSFLEVLNSVLAVEERERLTVTINVEIIVRL